MNKFASPYTVFLGILLAFPSTVHAEAQRLNTQEKVSTQSIEPLSEQGTHFIAFKPEQINGIVQGCTLAFRAWGRDYLYRNDSLFFIEGNMTYRAKEDRNGHALTLKIRIIDTVDSDQITRTFPFFAYIQTEGGTTAKSLFNQFSSPDTRNEGFTHFMYLIDNETSQVLLDTNFGSATIGFNRWKGGPDLLVPLDLTVASSTLTKTGVVYQRSDKMLRQFNDCVTNVMQQVLQPLLDSPKPADPSSTR